MRERPSRDLVGLVRHCHAALIGTRGAAISLAFLSPSERVMTWLGVGSVEGRVLSGGPVGDAPEGLARASQRRSRARAAGVSTATVDIDSGDVLMLATDGIDAGFADALAISGSPQAISDRILAAHGKPPDDALVIAVRCLGAWR